MRSRVFHVLTRILLDGVARALGVPRPVPAGVAVVLILGNIVYHGEALMALIVGVAVVISFVLGKKYWLEKP
jgi:hypothetical protein